MLLLNFFNFCCYRAEKTEVLSEDLLQVSEQVYIEQKSKSVTGSKHIRFQLLVMFKLVERYLMDVIMMPLFDHRKPASLVLP